MSDKVNPEHYKAHPSGVECIDITKHMSFCLGNVIKYVWRSDLKNGVEDLEKAKRYLEFEIKKRTGKEENKPYDSWDFCNSIMCDEIGNKEYCRENCKVYEFHQYLKENNQIIEEG